VELLLYKRDDLTEGRKLYLTEDDPLSREISEKWNHGLAHALENLPRFPWEIESLGNDEHRVFSFPGKPPEA
jgi:putative proteasome-type protease